MWASLIFQRCNLSRTGTPMVVPTGGRLPVTSHGFSDSLFPRPERGRSTYFSQKKLAKGVGMGISGRAEGEAGSDLRGLLSLLERPEGSCVAPWHSETHALCRLEVDAPDKEVWFQGIVALTIPGKTAVSSTLRDFFLPWPLLRILPAPVPSQHGLTVTGGEQSRGTQWAIHSSKDESLSRQKTLKGELNFNSYSTQIQHMQPHKCLWRKNCCKACCQLPCQS